MKKKTKRPSPEQGLFSFGFNDPAKEHVLQMIAEYLEKDIPSIIYGRSEMHKQSYSRWAAKELLSRLRITDAPPLIILESFRDEMRCYMSYSPTAQNIFLAAANTAEHFIRLLI